ncbi:hypothetical protein AMJ86_07935 [bacterium SM23_57]|jgi:hypothetical protein|nr:MAG: hypothetical protein AMJ86_07935 [bacterium SM23_57]
MVNMHGELGNARLRGVSWEHSTRGPDPDNAGGGKAIILEKIPPQCPEGFFNNARYFPGSYFTR